MILKYVSQQLRCVFNCCWNTISHDNAVKTLVNKFVLEIKEIIHIELRFYCLQKISSKFALRIFLWAKYFKDRFLCILYSEPTEVNSPAVLIPESLEPSNDP